jgi:hypothetical protein
VIHSVPILSIQTDPWADPASYPVGNEGSFFHGGKGARAGSSTESPVYNGAYLNLAETDLPITCRLWLIIQHVTVREHCCVMLIRFTDGWFKLVNCVTGFFIQAYFCNNLSCQHCCIY